MAVVLVVILIFSLRAIATFWTDFLWFDSLNLASVWRTLLSARLTLGAAATLVFFLILWLNLLVADRLGPKFHPVAGPEEEILERYRTLVAGRQRLVFFGVALVVALIPGISASSQWKDWLLFRYGGSFGLKDPQFHTDIGFYVFKLPFLSEVVDWVFGFLLVTTILVAIVHYLTGGIRVQPLGERVTPNAKAHLSVLLAIAALLKAADYWLQRYELTFSSGKNFDGAGYTDVNARLPAIQLLMLISLFAAVLLLFNIWRKGWVLPAIVVSLWLLIALVAGGIYPAFVQRFQVTPAELAKEKPFIQRNIDGTRKAMGLNNVTENKFNYDNNITQAKIDSQADNLTQARLLDPDLLKKTIQSLQFGRQYYAFNDVDVDRYQTSQPPADQSTPVIIASRELNQSEITNPSWEKLHLIFTHGYAAAMAPANTADSGGQPEFLVGDIPVTTKEVPPLTKPEIYIGDGMDGYAIVGTTQKELTTDTVDTKYDGKDGVSIGSIPRRAAFALRFGAIETLISDNLTSHSKVIFNRDITARVKAIAPFLTLDPDPYPVLLNGRIQYVLDGYTSTSHYPYSQSLDASQIGVEQAGTFNYLRNSVKAVIDAYDGTVTLYLSDTLYGGKQDPIIRAYDKAFPGLFTKSIPKDLAAHFRYPELLFKTQTQIWARYHQGNPSTFFNNSDRWDIAQQPPNSGNAVTTDAATAATQAVTGQTARIDPYYQMLQLAPGQKSQFVLTRPFVLASNDDSARNLTAVMIASNDPGSYGKLQQIEMVTKKADGTIQRNTDVDGPLQANQRMVTYPPLSAYQSLVGRNGSTVELGNLLILPFQNSLLYVRPVYSKEEQSGRNSLAKVAVTSGRTAGSVTRSRRRSPTCWTAIHRVRWVNHRPPRSKGRSTPAAAVRPRPRPPPRRRRPRPGPGRQRTCWPRRMRSSPRRSRS